MFEGGVTRFTLSRGHLPDAPRTVDSTTRSDETDGK